MYHNTNKKAIKNISNKNFKSHRVRNIIAILSIVLTTMLITTIFTTGISFYNTVEFQGKMGKGEDADGAIEGTLEQYEQIKKLDSVKWAGVLRDCSTTPIYLDKLIGIDSYLKYADKNMFDKKFVNPSEGDFPKNKDEILVPTFVLDILAMPYEIGQELEFDINIIENGKEIKKHFKFKICGYYKEVIPATSNYAEFYTDEEFITQYNKDIPKTKNKIYFQLKTLNKYSSYEEADRQISDIAKMFDADKYFVAPDFNNYNSMSNLIIVIVPIIIFVSMVMLCAYFLIYNVFYISITNDIKFFGILKTIGTTSKQIKAILLNQIFILSSIGITIGLIVGYIIGIIFTPLIISFTNFKDFMQISKNPFIFIFSAVFSFLTVYISCKKPFKIASTISPIEATKFTQIKTKKGYKKTKRNSIYNMAFENVIKNPKKTIITLLSLSFSGAIFISIYNISVGYNVNDMVERYNQSDFRIWHNTARYSQNEAYKPIDSNICDELIDLPFVKNVDIYYMARTEPDSISNSIETFYLESNGEIKYNGLIKQEIDNILNSGLPYNSFFNMQSISGRDTILLPIMSIPENKLEEEVSYQKILTGNIDRQEFETGDYILFISPNSYIDKTYGGNTLKAGDVLDLSIYDYLTDSYIDKSVTIMATLEKTDKYGKSNLSSSSIIMPNKLFKQIYTNYNDLISYIQVDTQEGNHKTQYDTIKRIINKTGNFQIKLNSKYETFLEQTKQKQSIMVIGFFISSIIGFIGIVNMLNTLVTNVISRKVEIATLQSIGMTQKQLTTMLISESIILGMIALTIIVPVSAIFTFIITKQDMFSKFNIITFISSLILTVIIILFISICISAIMVKIINRNSNIERLRQIE